MKKIIIIDCSSSSINYFRDIRKLNFEPIALEFYDKFPNSKIRKTYYKFHYSVMNTKMPLMIRTKKTYKATLATIKKLNPILIIPGSDEALKLSMRLSRDLCLKSNPLVIFKNLHFKDKMHEALKKAGIRYIKSYRINSLNDAIKYYKKLGGKDVVVKPSFGSASRNARICHSEKEVYNQAKLILSGKKDKAVIQEFINGKQYAVNSVSCEGIHKIVSASYQSMHEHKEGGLIHDYSIYFSPRENKYHELMNYVFKCLNALKIKYGPIHGEYRIDEKGPVLIEVNPRVSGLSRRADFLDLLFKNHETDIALLSYLNKDQFIKYPKLAKLYGYSITKNIIIPKDMFVIKSYLHKHLKKLKSYLYSVTVGENRLYQRTVSLATCGGIINLFSKNKKIVLQDLKTIKNLEKKCIDKLFYIKN